MRVWGVVGVTLALFATSAWGADQKALRNLQAPPPVAPVSFPAGAPVRAVKFARAVVQLKPEPWALVRLTPRYVGEQLYVTPPQLVSWNDSRLEIDTSAVATFVTEEMTLAGVPVDGASDSLFDRETSADLMLGVRIVEMEGNFCQGCSGLVKMGDRWSGAVTMTARWEVYSSLERRVLATIETRGGYTAPREGLAGEPERLVFEAFRDAVRRLIASGDFRRVVTADPSAGLQTAALTAITYKPGPLGRRTVASSASAVAAIFAGDGHGTGFLISSDGYLLTNQHVVGGAKYVKVRWADGAETVGEVVRSDRRRDIAIVKADPGQRQPLALRQAAPTLGEGVYAIGTPLDAKLQGSVSKGIVSATRTYEGLPYIQSDVTINGGNSGGPLLDESGAVLGVCVSGYDIGGAPIGINLFIPIDDALKALALAPAP